MPQSEKQTCKPWLSFDKQLSLLKDRGLIVDDFDRAKHYLSCLSYYRLSGYWYPFRKPIRHKVRDDKFIADTNFDDILSLYRFDKSLRLLCLDALERIEMALRTEVAYVLGRSHPEAHLHKKYLDGDFTKVDTRFRLSKHEIWLNRYEQQIKRASRQSLIKHYLNNYDGIPIWVVVEVLDFGSISMLYSGMKFKHRQEIADKYGVREDIFSSWMHSLNLVRNICAHHARLWNTNVSKPAKKVREEEGWQSLDRRKIFFYICLMTYLVKIINPRASWHKRVESLLKDFPTPNNNAVSIKDMGFEGWEYLRF